MEPNLLRPSASEHLMEERNVDEGEYSEGNEEDDDMIVRS
jgi:hypothetical protein